MIDLTIKSFVVKERSPDVNATYLCVTRKGGLYICDYGYTYNIFGIRSKRRKFINRMSRMRFEVEDVVAVSPVMDIFDHMVDAVQRDKERNAHIIGD